MNISIVGTGPIGTLLARKLSAAGHAVNVANSRGPETVPPAALAFGARAVWAEHIMADAEVLILSLPPTSFEKIRPLLQKLADHSVIIDTSNYYPQRDGSITLIDAGQVESEWVSEQLGRPVIKAWNTVGAASLADKGRDKNEAGRIALPVSGDPAHSKVAMALVEDTGFDGYYAGALSASWRQQPGAAAYCTDLSLDELIPALESAEKSRLPIRRDIAVQAMMERGFDNLSTDYFISLNRALFL